MEMMFSARTDSGISLTKAIGDKAAKMIVKIESMPIFSQKRQENTMAEETTQIGVFTFGAEIHYNFMMKGLIR